jgi:hypothetical protein
MRDGCTLYKTYGHTVKKQCHQHFVLDNDLVDMQQFIELLPSNKAIMAMYTFATEKSYVSVPVWSMSYKGK